MNKVPFFSLQLNHFSQAFYVALRFLSLIFLAGCGVQSEINPTRTLFTPLPTTPTVQNSQTVFLTATRSGVTTEPTVTVTTSLSPSFTPTATKTPTVVIPTATKTITPTPTATLTMEEWQEKWQLIDARIEAMMASNNDCQIPCWWGIKPGDSVADAQQIFNTINENGWVDSPSQRGELERSGYFRHDYRTLEGLPVSLNLSVDLIRYEDKIKIINVSVYRSANFQPDSIAYRQISEHLMRDWEQFSAQNMFETFGKPDLIYLLPRNFADGDNYFYEFNLYYLSLGIVVSYSSPLFDNGDGNGSMCLTMFDIDALDLILYDPAFELPFDYLQATYSLWPLDTQLTEESPLVKSSDLESRTGLNIDEFMNYIQYSDNDCFSVN